MYLCYSQNSIIDIHDINGEIPKSTSCRLQPRWRMTKNDMHYHWRLPIRKPSAFFSTDATYEIRSWPVLDPFRNLKFHNLHAGFVVPEKLFFLIMKNDQIGHNTIPCDYKLLPEGWSWYGCCPPAIQLSNLSALTGFCWMLQAEKYSVAICGAFT